MVPSPTLAKAIAAVGRDIDITSTQTHGQSDQMIKGGVVDRAGFFSDEWLQALWAYLTETNSLSLFQGTVPLLPVRGWSQSTNQQIAQISTHVPILHMSFRDISADTMEALADLGIRVLDSTVLGQLSYSHMVEQFITPRSPKGVMLAFSIVAERISFITTSWNASKKDAIRKFIYNEVLSKSKSFAL